MDIKVSNLKTVMDLVKPVIAKKPTIKALAYLCLKDGKAIATDLETMIIANLPEATESMLLPYSSIAETLKYISGMDTLHLELQGKVIILSWKGGTASYPTEDVADYPILGELTTRAEGLINGDALLAAMKLALPYVATDATRPVLNGITLVLGNPLEVNAGDGFRMSHQVLGLSFPLEEKIIIPTHAVSIMEHVFSKTPRTPPSDTDSLIDTVISKRQLHMALIGDNKLKLDFGTSASLVINLTAGSPPNWMSLIPSGEVLLQSQIFAPQLEAAAKRIHTIAKEGSDIIRIEFADGKVKLSAKGGDQEISTTIDAILTQGEPGRTAVNYKYLLEFTKDKSSIITITKYTESGPLVFEYGNTPKVLIMPMQCQWPGDEPTAPPIEPAAAVEAESQPTDEVAEEGEETETSGEEESETETVEETADTE